MALIHKYPVLHKARLIKRYKRFLFDAKMANGEVITGLTPNTGSMMGVAEPGSKIMMSYHPDPKRKTHYTLEMIQVGDVWVGLNTQLANRLAGEVIRKKLAGRELASYTGVIKPEQKTGDSRLDFYLTKGERAAYAEVKNVTLAEGRRALFPDAVTARGLKHLSELSRLAQEGYGAFLLFTVQRSDCNSFSPAVDIDPAYADGLCQAVKKGVKPIALLLDVTPEKINFVKCLPVKL